MDGSRGKHHPSGKEAQNPDGSREDNCSSNLHLKVAATIKHLTRVLRLQGQNIFFCKPRSF